MSFDPAKYVNEAMRGGPPADPRRLATIRGLGPEDTGRRPILKGLWCRGELSAVYGPPKSGKSFLVTDAALAVAGGAEGWFGHRVKQRGQVLYLALEGGGGFWQRLKAWSRHHGREVPSSFNRAAERLSFVIEPTMQNAVDDVGRIQTAIARLENETDEPVVLVVVDTVARAMVGADENSASDMGRFLEACGRLQAWDSQPHVCVVHHAGKDGERGSRGSTALPAGVDVLAKVERGELTHRWRVEWAKDDPETEWRGFQLEPADLGTDEDGDPVTSCVPLPADSPKALRRRRDRQPTGTNQRLVWRAFTEVEADDGRTKRPTMLVEVPYAAVAMKDVRSRAYSLADWPVEKQRDRFREAINGLVGQHWLDVDSARDWTWRHATD